MQIIGQADTHNHFIAIVSKSEIEKVFDLYYGNMKKDVKIGDVINLGGGHDFRGEIQDACRKMADAMKAFDSAKETMMRFAVMVSQLNKTEET